MKTAKNYASENGFQGRLVGSSLTIADANGKIIYHNTNSDLRTMKDLVKFVDAFPDQLEALEASTKRTRKYIIEMSIGMQKGYIGPFGDMSISPRYFESYEEAQNFLDNLPVKSLFRTYNIKGV